MDDTSGEQMIPADQAAVGRYYDSTIFDYELKRLDRSPVEFSMTSRYLAHHVPPGAIVADIGVGAGHYAEFLARRGCTLYLVDISQRLLDSTMARLRKAGFEDAIAGTHRGTATNLSHLPAAGLDAAIMLGPLYHLLQQAERQLAVQEAAGRLKPGGLLFAAGINRLSYLRDTLRDEPSDVIGRKHFHARFLLDGNLDPQHAPPIGHAHLSTPAEFRQLFAELLAEVSLVGLESFASTEESRLLDLTHEAREEWLDLIEATGRTPEGLAQSDHFLYIGRKRSLSPI
ncbi:MAG TPA: class I SAM-dependent methyltransferase [Anaerolineae bacterium]|jgi:SAM-dependent methyltransferase|nr:class I SAM-dependent methyltransferase [Anaerolineae bacterium]